MAASVGHVLSQIQRWTSPRLGDLSDAVLLERFVQRREEAAFAALVARHGAMVLRSCRRVLGDAHEAEDAFQATFLILARKAHTLRQPEALPGWLYGVARRVALKARTKAAVRSGETQLPDTVPDSRPDPLSQLTARELLTVLDEEVGRLPAGQRSAVVLCCLEGHSQEEAAGILGWTAGSLKGHLEHGRRRLQARLERRGIALPAALAVAAVSRGEAATALLQQSAVRAAQGGGIGSSAAALAHSVLQGMFASKLAGVMGIVLTVVLATSAAVTLAYRGPVPEAPEDKTPAVPVAPKNAGASKLPPWTDALGDTLPPGALARLGSLRLYHGHHVHRVTLSPDGKWVVSAALDGNRLWEAATGRELPLRKELREAAIFATRDKLVGVANHNPDLQLWDIASGKKIGGLLPAAKVGQLPVALHFGVGFTSGQSPLGLSPDGRTLVIFNWGQGGPPDLHFCDVVRGHVEEPIPLKLDDGVQAQMAFSADSKTLVLQRVGKGYAKVHVWDVDRRTEIIASPSNIQDYSGEIALSPDGKILATFSSKRVRSWDTRTLKELPPLLKQPDEYRGAVTFSPDGKQLAASHSGPIVRLWDLASRKEVRQFRGKDTQIFHLAYSADGKYLVAGDGAVVTFWDVATGKFRHDHWHTSVINSVAFSPDGKRLVSGAARPDNIVRVWDPLTGKETAQLRGHKEGIAVVAYSPDGKLIASAGEDKTIRLWDAATGRELRRLGAEGGFVYAMAFAPDGKTIAIGGGRHHRTVHLWDVATGRELRSFKLPDGIMLRMTLSPDGKRLATCGALGTDICLWDVAKGEQIHQLAGSAARWPSLAFSPDSKTLAVGGDDGSVRLWDVDSGEKRPALVVPRGADRGGPVDSIAFSPDGRILAAGYGFASGHEGEGCMVQLWELSSGRVRIHYKRQGNISHWRSIESLAFSPDSSLLATGGHDRIIMIWDLTGQRTARPPRQGRLAAGELNALWSDLGDADARKAYGALQTLIGAGQQAVSLLKDHLRPAAAIDERRIDRLIADLDRDEFAVRQKAARELREMGDAVESALRKVLAGKPSAEQRLRVKQLLEEIDAARSPERLRRLRAVEVLERLSTPDAQQVLRTLADGDPHARLTREAKAALERLANGRR